MDKKILITGISGFVGSHLVNQLLETPGIKIYGTYLSEKNSNSLLDTSKITLKQLDLMNAKDVFSLVEEIKPDQVYHLAALTSAKLSFDDPSEVLVNNITAELNLLEAIRKLELKTRIFITSSAEVYGIVDPANLPINEEAPLRPANPYAVSKIAQDFLGLQYNISYGVDIIRVRPFNHIGPGQNDQFATSAFAKKIAQIEKGEGSVLTVGNLESKRDFTDVKDMVRAYVLLMEKGKSGEVYNVGSGKSYKMSEVLDILLSFSSSEVKIEKDPKLLRPSDNPDLCSDNSKMFALTGWQPEIPLEQTLKEILEYWRKVV